MICIPIIRTELNDYIGLWNIHLIRKQPERPYLKTGKPYVWMPLAPPLGLVRSFAAEA